MKLSENYFLILLFFPFALHAQLENQTVFTHADTLRGSITPERAWWNVIRYDIKINPEYKNKTIQGNVLITFRVKNKADRMQIDLQKPMKIDSFLIDGEINDTIGFTKTDTTLNVWYFVLQDFVINSIHKLTIFYHGKPTEAVKPPWDGGLVWAKDSLDRPWISIACQGLGASVWFPCKDHQSDEPDFGASLSITVPDTLMAVANGTITSSQKNNDATATYTWAVKNPINNYTIIPYIGKYINFSDTLHGEKGTLNLNYWVLDYNLKKAKQQFTQVKPMLRCFEHWFGPYPFYKDGYKLVDAPYLGMEHQSAVAYGNGYKNGYHGVDLSETGWGMKWDFIIVHESGHEWFGNNITSKDIADMWIHESFTNYSETLYTEWFFGEKAANEYNYGIRKNIKNDEPIISSYNVNKEGSGDMYCKGGNMIHSIRHIINNDEKFRNILRGLNKRFYHQTVSTQQVENYLCQKSGIDLSKVFNQYLRTIQIPQLQYYYSPDNKQIFFRWANCIHGFNMPLVLKEANSSKNIRINPTEKWSMLTKTIYFNTAWIEKNYYISIKEVQPNK